jgi:anti-anti-sigma factor
VTESLNYAVDARSCVIALSGELTPEVGRELEEQIASVSAEGPKRVVVDLLALDRFGTAGLAGLVGALRRGHSAIDELIVVSTVRRLEALLQATGVYEHVALVPTLRQALGEPS